MPKTLQKDFYIKEENEVVTPTFHVLNLKGPGRVLRLTIEQHRGSGVLAYTYIKQEKTQQHQQGITKALYERAREVLQRIANARGPIRYEVSTTSSRMKYFFTKGAGNSMFEWDKPPEEKPTWRLKRYATIRPNK